MSDLRAEVVAEARRWIDTPVSHLGGAIAKDRSVAARGLRADCFGLAIGVGVATGVFVDPGAELDPYLNYGRLPDSARMKEALDRFLIPIGMEHEDGDIAFLAWGAYHYPMHLAIMATFEERVSMIHANGLIKPRRVRENTYGGDWPNRLHGFYRYPGLA